MSVTDRQTLARIDFSCIPASATVNRDAGRKEGEESACDVPWIQYYSNALEKLSTLPASSIFWAFGCEKEGALSSVAAGPPPRPSHYADERPRASTCGTFAIWRLHLSFAGNVTTGLSYSSPALGRTGTSRRFPSHLTTLTLSISGLRRGRTNGPTGTLCRAVTPLP